MRSPAVFALSACFFGFSLLGFSTAHAQHSQQQGSATNAPAATSAVAMDAQFKANILKLLDLTHAMALGHDAAARMLQSLRPTLIAALPPTEHREQIADAYGDKLTALLTGQTMTDQLAGIYARHLSAEDVAAMIQFYQTPAGQHSLASLPQIMAESQQLGANVAQENLPRILRELCTEFPELRGKVKFCPAGTGNESSGLVEREWPVVSGQWSVIQQPAGMEWRKPVDGASGRVVNVSLKQSERADSAASTSQQSAPSDTLEVPGSEMEARLVHVVAPVYPQIAVVAHVSGTVLMHAIIAEDGRLKTITYISGPALLKQAAMNAVRQWRYQAYVANGKTVSVDTTVSVVFSLAREMRAIQLPEDVMMGKLIHKTLPEYPAKAEAARVSGAVVLEVIVADDGKVKKSRAISGPAMLVKAAQDTVKKWRFEPTVRNGLVVPVDTRLTVSFGAPAEGANL